MIVLSLKNFHFIFQASIVLKSMILLFVHPISLCCPVLFQARPIDSLNRTSIYIYWGEPERAPHLSYCCAKSSLYHRVGRLYISKDERGFPVTQYITNGRISRGGYTFTHFKHHHRVLQLISYSMSV